MAAVVVSVADARSGILRLLQHTGFTFPVFLATVQPSEAMDLPPVTGLLDGSAHSLAQAAQAADHYQETLLPPFFATLTKYVAMNNSTFACPGHQGGAFFRKHPAGRQFYEFYGENLFRSDMCNADVRLGDLVLFDRNNHKSNHHGALIQAGATPVYLEAARNPFGFIGSSFRLWPPIRRCCWS